MSDKLAVRSSEVPETYLLARVVRTLPSPEYFLRRFQTEISTLIVDELKSFGGTITRPEDKRRAELRILKLVNLGLEKAANIKGKDGSDYDFQAAKAILLNKPIALIYTAGKMIFENGKSKTITDLLEEGQVNVDGMWFRLLSAQEFEALNATTSLDFARGTLKEYSETLEVAKEATRKFQIVPLLPINHYGLGHNKQWGSTKKGEYPIEHGIIDCFLLSLLISCMFRSEEELFSNREDLATLRRMVRMHDNAASDRQSEVYLESVRGLGRVMEEDRKIMDSPGIKLERLANFLQVSIEEIKQFADMIFFEPALFSNRTLEIRERFFQYFIVASKKLKIRIPGDFLSHIPAILHSTAEKIQKEVREFYSGFDNPDISNADIVKFWAQRVDIVPLGYTESRETEEAKAITMAKRAVDHIDVAKLIAMSNEAIVETTRYFSIWKLENKKAFCENFNPNVFLRRDRSALNLVKLLKHLSPSSDTGWEKEMLKENTKRVSSTEIALSDSLEEDWAKNIIDKIAWNIIHPSIITEMWQLGSDRVRDMIFNRRENIKVSMPALKAYYITDHRDTRLLLYALEKLINEDKLKPIKETWENLLGLAKELPKARVIIELKYKEVMKSGARG